MIFIQTPKSVLSTISKQLHHSIRFNIKQEVGSYRVMGIHLKKRKHLMRNWCELYCPFEVGMWKRKSKSDDGFGKAIQLELKFSSETQF